VFLLPSLVLGVVFALILGGRPSRLLDIDFRHGWTVFAALAVQIVLFSPAGEYLPPQLVEPVHLGSYGLLFIFAFANGRNLALLPIFLGMLCNAVAIIANGGRMPVSPSAADAAALDAANGGNTRLGAETLGFLGDVFALPANLPFANVFSVGDLLIGFGMIGLIVAVSTSETGQRTLVPGRLVRPLAHAPFRRLVAGKLVSHLGDWLTMAALIGWIYGETGSTGHVAALLLVRLAPPILGGALAAAIVDRLPRRRLLVAVEVARGGVVAVALSAVLIESEPLALIAVGVSGALAAVSATTVRALVPALLDDEQLPAANAGLGVAQDVAMAAGALLAGVVLATSTVATALLIDLATFAVAAALYAGVCARPLPVAGERGQGGILAGFGHLLRRRLLLTVVVAFGSATLATGLTNASLPRFLDVELGLGTGAYGYGLAALAAGLAVGQAAVGLARVGRTGGRWIGAALLVMSAFVVLLGLTSHAPTAVLLLALIGLVDGTTDVLFDTIVQREADPRFHGRVFGLASSFMTATMMGAVAAAPLVNRIAPPREVIIAAGLVLLVPSVVALVGTRSRAPSPREEEEEEHARILRLVRGERRPQGPPTRVIVRLVDGSSVEAGLFPDAESAATCASELMRRLRSSSQGDWPLLGDRYVRPEATVSIELVEATPAAAADAATRIGSP
jgi:MFS family permease